jgi:hypothetical protein
MSEITALKSNTLMSEAPASWNTRYVTPDGFICQLTLRGDTGKDLLEKANAALNWLKDNQFLPCENNGFHNKQNIPNNQNGKVDNNNNNHDNQSSPSWCPIHQCEMKRWEKDGRIWFSHNANGSWCTGKSK